MPLGPEGSPNLEDAHPCSATCCLVSLQATNRPEASRSRRQEVQEGLHESLIG